MHGWPVRGGVFPYFLPQRCSCRRRARGEPPRWLWCPIGEGKSFPGSRRLRLWGQGAPRASPRSWPWRSAAQAPPACGKARVLRHRPFLWCAWATQCSSEHVGQVERSSRGSGDFGHGGSLPSTTAARRAGLYVALVGWSRRACGSSDQDGRDEGTPGAPSEPVPSGVDVVAAVPRPWCGEASRVLQWPTSTHDRERGVFRGGKKPAKAVA